MPRTIEDDGYSWTFYVTAKDGGEAKVVGDVAAIEAVKRALEKDGWKFNSDVGCWDQGFYDVAFEPVGD